MDLFTVIIIVLVIIVVIAAVAYSFTKNKPDSDYQAQQPIPERVEDKAETEGGSEKAEEKKPEE